MKRKAHNPDSEKTVEVPVEENLAQEVKSEAGSEDSTPSNDVEALKVELEEKKKEAAELYDRLLRNQAETENFRKRMLKERADVVRYATDELINNLLPVLDAFEHGINAAENTKDFDALVDGVKLISNQLKDVLQKAGLTDVAAYGEQFDPNHHEAVRVVETEEHDDNTVVEELRKGYILNGRVLRPAMVSVSKK